MSNDDVIKILRNMKRNHKLRFSERTAIAWCIAKLLKDSASEEQKEHR